MPLDPPSPQEDKTEAPAKKTPPVLRGLSPEQRSSIMSKMAKSHWAKVRENYLKKCDEIHRQERLEAQRQAEEAEKLARRGGRKPKRRASDEGCAS